MNHQAFRAQVPTHKWSFRYQEHPKKVTIGQNELEGVKLSSSTVRIRCGMLPSLAIDLSRLTASSFPTTSLSCNNADKITGPKHANYIIGTHHQRTIFLYPWQCERSLNRLRTKHCLAGRALSTAHRLGSNSRDSDDNVRCIDGRRVLKLFTFFCSKPWRKIRRFDNTAFLQRNH
jgi:hypothetical protein